MTHATAVTSDLSGANRHLVIAAKALLTTGPGWWFVLDEPDDPRTEEPDFVNLERVEGRWLVDEIHEDIGTAGTEAPGTPAA
jgi:hypothetical protein